MTQMGNYHRWVNKYIGAYGGDVDNVNLFGMSAGGASVHYHMLSPGSRGLFKSAVSLSGSSLNWWANVPDQKKNAEKLAGIMGTSTFQKSRFPHKYSFLYKKLGCKDASNLGDCLREKPALDLINAHNEFYDWRPENPGREPMNVFSPRAPDTVR